jgi:hypothetical protein
MRFEDIDWSKFPTSRWTIQTTLSFQSTAAVASLNRYLQRIHRMEQLAQDDVEALQKEWDSKPHPGADLHGYEPVTAEQETTFETDRGMYALLAVAIAARVEKWLFDLCENRKLKYRTKNDKTNVDIARKSLAAAAISYDKLNGYESYEKAAMLGHKFKHNDGLADAEFSSQYGVPEGQPIEYENEDWPAMIAGVSTHLDELSQHFQE